MLYVFLYLIIFIGTIFAIIEDIKTRKINRYITNLMMIGALLSRIYYSWIFKDGSIILLGLIGLISYLILGFIFYYLKIFGGGDIHLLFAYGILLPFNNYITEIFGLLVFLFLLFLIGLIYGLVYRFSILSSKSKNKLIPFSPVFLICFILLIFLNYKLHLL